jgi:hypothetical protein
LNWILAGLPSISEIRHLLSRLVFNAVVPKHGFVWAWSRWRRQHQAAAANAHYRKRSIEPQL